jgi:hypothetical protein
MSTEVWRRHQWHHNNVDRFIPLVDQFPAQRYSGRRLSAQRHYNLRAAVAEFLLRLSMNE